MREKLVTFSEFAMALYPHEVEYLLSVQQLEKSENIKILNLVNYNSKNPLNRLPYDTSIDKRTYSYIKKWIEETLEKVDVDHFYNWLLTIEQSVMSDSITPEQEKALKDQAMLSTPSRYYFLRLYQVIQHYRDYLIVRNRTRYYAEVSDYLNKYHKNYIRSTTINNRLNNAAEKIAIKGLLSDKEFTRMESFFKSVYFDENLDGYTRYRAAVRLTILYYTYREFDSMRELYDSLDAQFKTEVFYSKRILANYYSNRAMMHSKLNELDLAEKYGYLSVRAKNSDYLFYLINLCGVLLRSNKNKEALKIMTQSIPELKNTNSFYYKIGFVAFYIRTLNANGMLDKAISYASTFLEGYKKEIFEHRWHLFFSAYIQVLFRAEKYSKIISLSKRYRLVAREKQSAGSATYLPTITWYTAASEYFEGAMSKERFHEFMLKSAGDLISSKYKTRKVRELLNDLMQNLPVVMKSLKDELNL